eukprot:542427_1
MVSTLIYILLLNVLYCAPTDKWILFAKNTLTSAKVIDGFYQIPVKYEPKDDGDHVFKTWIYINKKQADDMGDGTHMGAEWKLQIRDNNNQHTPVAKKQVAYGRIFADGSQSDSNTPSAHVSLVTTLSDNTYVYDITPYGSDRYIKKSDDAIGIPFLNGIGLGLVKQLGIDKVTTADLSSYLTEKKYNGVRKPIDSKILRAFQGKGEKFINKEKNEAFAPSTYTKVGFQYANSKLENSVIAEYHKIYSITAQNALDGIKDAADKKTMIQCFRRHVSGGWRIKHFKVINRDASVVYDSWKEFVGNKLGDFAAKLVSMWMDKGKNSQKCYMTVIKLLSDYFKNTLKLDRGVLELKWRNGKYISYAFAMALKISELKLNRMPEITIEKVDIFPGPINSFNDKHKKFYDNDDYNDDNDLYDYNVYLLLGFTGLMFML